MESDTRLSARPSGLVYQPDFLSTADCEHLVTLANTFTHWDRMGPRKRRLAFGYFYQVSAKAIKAAAPAPPPELATLAKRLVDEGFVTALPNQIVFQEYPPGIGIGSHKDSPEFGPEVCSLSMLSTCKMRFELEDRRFDQILEPGSLLVIRSEARDLWKHGIPASSVKSLRMSITFRTVRSA